MRLLSHAFTHVIRNYKQANFILYCGMVDVYFNGIVFVIKTDG